jgi:hypothetical protein
VALDSLPVPFCHGVSSPGQLGVAVGDANMFDEAIVYSIARPLNKLFDWQGVDWSMNEVKINRLYPKAI